MATSNSVESLDVIKYLKPGMKISATIQFGPDDNLTFATTLIGYKAEQFILLDITLKAQEQLVMRKLNNVQIIVRGISDTELGHVVAFSTSIMQAITVPSALLFLRLPTHFVTKTIREHERYKLSLPVVLTEYTEQHGERKFDGQLVDLSISGCGIFIGGENELNIKNRVSFSSDLDTFLPDGLAGHIAGIRRQAQGHLIGVQFKQPIQLSDELKMSLFEQFFKSNSL